MVAVRKWGEDHINRSLKQIDLNTWLIGSLILHRSPRPSGTATWNDESDNSSYTLTEAPILHRFATSQPNSPYINLVHEAGDASAVWSIGNSALCKIRYIEEGVTPESVTSLPYPGDMHPSYRLARTRLAGEVLYPATQIRLAWIPRHSRVPGNETAHACGCDHKWAGRQVQVRCGKEVQEAQPAATSSSTSTSSSSLSSSSSELEQV
ncbi:hypothetical protein K469DRAFT_154025 [Zopfia rhizophila CBS 207.26]|uniref:Uncharacterized protein n=1 Tax=Zopfia rhizophila CBS 207.26 TaxID=1314779 RepID=A0A6A6E7G6_9PEZI|nr:hypothetical protein K469DRAFT_154025 [Zopfia rhizophila CBS 207.26]